ncbi:MAG: S-ribosylhomocysteine lyase [Clostridia bacterium]|nr:S-ribosylhomocysteine lyase [Clostridia bacterium]
MELKQIASFQVDHTKLTEGMYTSRVDGDVTTYDLRMVRPNHGVYLDSAAMHTIEHLFATYVRSGPRSDSVIYVGPMGCRTGFYFLVRGLPHAEAIRLVRDSMDFIASYDGPIPGATERECGNYREQDLAGAKSWAEKMRDVLKDWTEEKLKYAL